MGAVSKLFLIEALCDELGLSKADAKVFVEDFFEEIKSSLSEGCSVKLSGLGQFKLNDKAARVGRNLRTGQDAPISARRVVTFKASVGLKKK